MARIGVLALQGDFEAHARALRAAGAEVVEVRRCAALLGLDGLVLPGGESTTLLKLMEDEPWLEELGRFHREGGAIFGTCAGAILLAREVRNPAQRSLGLLDAVVERNSFGRQTESFEAAVDAPSLGGTLDGVFIRAPRFREVGPEVEVLGRLGGEPVLVRQGRILAGTFHPELASGSGVHGLFVAMARERSHAAGKARKSVRAGGSTELRRRAGCAAAPARTGG
jgi:5'-phosphate synthase pdxT subunit